MKKAALAPAAPLPPAMPSSRPAALALGRWAAAQLFAAALIAALFTWIAGMPPKAEPKPAAAAKKTRGQISVPPMGQGGGRGTAGPSLAEGGSGRAPAFRLASLDGKESSLADYQGKVVVLDFWATWCGPCRAQAEILDEMHGSLPQNVVFLGINVGEDKKTVERYASRSPFPYPTLLDQSQQVAAQYGAQGLPTLVVIGPKGDVVFHNVGVTSAGRLAKAIEDAAAG
jgi:thiol-disulfide isomerase/thioredoxin